jgi:hypothetical protein
MRTVAPAASELLIFTEIKGEFEKLPAASLALADKDRTPLEASDESQDNENGGAVISDPRFDPSKRNCTPVMPTLSEAEAEIRILPLRVAPVAGLITETVGAWVSAEGDVAEIVFDTSFE